MNLEDRLEILDLISNLAYYNDTINEEGYRNLFVEDCNRTIRFRDGELRDTSEDGLKMGHVKMLAEQGIIDKHYYVNPVLKQISDTKVEGKVSALILNQHLDEPVPKLASFGTCDLVFIKTGEGWRIQEFHVHLHIPDPFTHGEAGVANSLVKIVDDYLDARRNAQHEKLFSLLHDDVKILGASGKRYGKKEIKKYFKGSKTPFGEMDYQRVSTYVVGNTVIIESLMNAVHVGEYNGIAPSGKRFELPSVELFEIKDEKIISTRQYQNNKILSDLHNL